MYVTATTINRESLLNRKFLTDLTNMNKVHQLVTRILDSKRENEHILYRIKYKNDMVILYFQSDSKPSQTTIEDLGLNYVGCMELNIEGKEGDTIIYNVLAHPCTKKDGKTSFIKDYEKQKEWIAKKLEDSGLSIVSEPIITRANDVSFEKKNCRATLFTREFTGKAVIKNKEMLMDSIQNGIGIGKNYGLGMLFVS